jgi:hypothetical protein
MGTKTTPGQFDCYAAAGPDEPMFVLLGRDKHAGLIVRLWALLRARDGEDEAKIADALATATAMDRHAQGLGKDPVAIEERHRAILMAATEKLEQHPDDYDSACCCGICMGE